MSKASQDPIIPESTTTGTPNSCPLCPTKKDSENTAEENLQNEETQLELMWDKIQELKQTDEFAAHVMYEKYKARAGELPPPIPSHIIMDQAVS